MPFEAAERTLEVVFGTTTTTSALPDTVSPFDLRSLLSHADWAKILRTVGIEILSTKVSEHATAYLLSESSLFVWSERFLLKTCGQSMPLLVLSMLL